MGPHSPPAQFFRSKNSARRARTHRRLRRKRRWGSFLDAFRSRKTSGLLQLTIERVDYDGIGGGITIRFRGYVGGTVWRLVTRGSTRQLNEERSLSRRPASGPCGRARHEARHGVGECIISTDHAEMAAFGHDNARGCTPAELGLLSALPKRYGSQARIVAVMNGRGARRRRAVLLLGCSTDVEDIKRALGSDALEFVVAFSTTAASVALRASPIDVVVVSSEAPTEWIDELLGAINRIRPGVPVLAVRQRRAEERATWREHRVGVLREPLLPDALARSVDAVLALRES